MSNSAIAAERCLRAGRRPAVLDIDLHHGNGTQAVYYARQDVLTVSIHADPSRFYPFFWGHAGERGVGAGHGYNLNLPLPLGTGDDGFLAALAEAGERIRLFGADILITPRGSTRSRVTPSAEAEGDDRGASPRSPPVVPPSNATWCSSRRAAISARSSP
ncbi:MAG: hypothetical protein R3C69_10375 [Geminicoccaceae bacterium]